MNSAPWQLLAFGKPRLLDPTGQAVRCEARTLALLVYLTLEGPTSRSRLAGLLWPDTPEAAARNNLVHLLRRIGKSHDPGLVQAGEAVALGPALALDLQGWEEGGADVPSGPLLDGLGFDEQPDLAEWLLAWRERLDLARAGHLARRATEAEEAGALDGALDLTRRLLDLDPLSEDAWRRLMRLHYLAGDRPAALKAYHRCQEVLSRELGVTPLPETRELASLIDRGSVAPSAAPAAARIPLAVRRPPVLVGRADVWARMAAAWERGQGIILTGEPGAGKTRLALDFLAAHGGGMRFEGRPGDAGLLYATHARTYGQVLAAYPDLPLAPWIREELSRLLPGLGGTPEPIVSEEQKLRFWRAKVEVLGAAVQRGLRHMVFDDVQFMDEASVEAGGFVFAQLGWGQPDAPYRTIHIFRKGELSPLLTGMLQALVSGGLVELIEVGPLGEEDVQGLLEQLELPLDAQLPERLRRFTGGNPLLLLETVRSLHEAQAQTGTLPEALPLPEKAGAVISGRLGRLSAPALQAARAAAILGSDFDLELVAETLRAPLLDVAAAWEELETAQIVVGERFEHDLVAEALRQEIPEGVRRLLHRAAARVMGGSERAAPARVAGHWLAGGDAAQAAPWLLQAGQAAWHAARQVEAAQYFAQAAEHFGPVDERAAFGALALRAEVLANMDDPGHADAVRALHDRAVTPLERATAFMQTYRAVESTIDVEQIEPAVQAGLSALRAAEPGRETWLVEAQLTEGLALVAYIRGHHAEVRDHLRRLADLGERAASLEWQAKAQEGLGLALSAASPREATAHLERAEALHLRRGDLLRAGSSLAKLARVQCELGEVGSAQASVARGEQHLGRLDANHGERVALLFSQIMVAHLSGDLDLAARLHAHAHRTHSPDHSALLGFFPVLQARTLRLGGQLEGALAELALTRDGRAFPAHLLALRALEEAAILLALKRREDAQAPLDEAEALLQAAPNVAWQARLHDLRAEQEAGDDLAHQLAAQQVREQHGLPPGHWSAL
ncbi:hypothetical protein GO986_22315 [Deinococcus sp. HMF7620]|uniref:Bacterial transcriptional activator domain-containing protein n=1 Tax=Deinococcus arboris TaxID=2682977 RepID=A0A7C9HUL1_9DEIO|nr:BTAD domain-containing putative transcriptional regulator [Deinococcus arboris]MVN89473.1 hypothetical protein [Deinococcus arboris]